MPNFAHSSVTYTSVPCPVEVYSDIGSPEVDGPPSPDYVPGPEEPEQASLSPNNVSGLEEPEQAPPSPVYLPYVPELVYPKYMAPEDDGDLEEEDEEDPADYLVDSTVVTLPAVDHIPSEEKRLRFASPTPSQEVGESSVAGAARQDEPAVLRDDPYSLVREELYGFVDREREARMAREAWGLSMDASDNGRSDVMSLRTTALLLHWQHMMQIGMAMIAILQEREMLLYGGTPTLRPLLLKAHAMPWRTLKKMMRDKYYPRGEIKKIEFEMWNLKVKGTDVVAYSQRFQELALIKSDDTTQNNHQQLNKRQNTGRAYAVGNGDRRAYEGPRPLCTKCNYHHDGPCAPKCHKGNRFGHLSRDCRNLLNVNTRANQRGKVCFECGAQGHFKKECPKL
nr:hypothetical protein [Tanacetum cinerariifolium]